MTDDSPLELEELTRRVGILGAYLQVCRAPERLLGLVSGATDAGQAIALVREACGFDETQARSVLDLQVHRFTQATVDRIAAEHAELEGLLGARNSRH